MTFHLGGGMKNKLDFPAPFCWSPPHRRHRRHPNRYNRPCLPSVTPASPHGRQRGSRGCATCFILTPGCLLLWNSLPERGGESVLSLAQTGFAFLFTLMLVWATHPDPTPVLKLKIFYFMQGNAFKKQKKSLIFTPAPVLCHEVEED